MPIPLLTQTRDDVQCLFYVSAHLVPSIYEPTLNELVGLKKGEDPWPIPTTIESSAKSTCLIRRIDMTDIEQRDGSLQGGRHLSLSTFDEPNFYNSDTNLWRYWPTGLAQSLPGLVFPKANERTVDPWDISYDVDPPFYRRFCTKPPYESGMNHKIPKVDPDGPQPLSYGHHQIENLKTRTSPGSHNTSSLHSHL